MTRFVAFDEVETCGPHEGLVGFSVDLPAAGSEEPYHSVPLLGWALGRDEPVSQIEVRDGREALFSLPVTMPRPDIEAAFGSVPGAGTCGFEGEIGSVTQRRRFELTLVAVTGSGARMRLATVRGRRRPHAPRGTDGIQPLMLTTIGRSGSTWLSGLLGHHPAILAHLPWAYDWRFTAYWFEAMRWLTHPSAYLQQVLPDISSARWWLGDRGVTYHLRDRHDPDFEDWLGSAEVEHTIDMCITRLRETLARVAAQLGRPDAGFAIEKCMPGHFVPPLVHELLPGAREVFLVRDFRDVACSVIDFSTRTSVRWSRPRGARTDADYVRLALSDDARLLLSDWRERAASAHLVRYEDLVGDPQATLTALFDHAGVDSAPATVQHVIRMAALEAPDAQAEHRTSPSVEASVGRWRSDLQPDVLAACEETLAEPLQAFGYGR